HYAFGALDLYAAESDCWDPAWELSVMGLDLRASELDDETHRCPNEDDIPGYVPSWTLLRQRYPLVHDRSEPDAGPAGDGGAFSLTVWRLLDLEPVFEDDFEDDAGSGRDAGESRADAVDVAPGVVHRGTIVDTASDTDFYRIAVPGPGTLRVRLGSATVACVYLDGEDETACADGASLFYIEEEIERAFAAAGEAYLVVDGGFVSHYSFSFAWDAEPPPPFPSVAFPP
ncbi:MAG TPA: hypothetical protein VHH36_07795, partial [Candidatus Thermoplasmatota archaeon]|nr:hypothetical protein [Candidatus Thermoplasmatota archaeon]